MSGDRAVAATAQISGLPAVPGRGPEAREEASQASRAAVSSGSSERKCNYEWLLRNPTDLGRVWELAEGVLAQSGGAKPGSARQYRLALHTPGSGRPGRPRRPSVRLPVGSGEDELVGRVGDIPRLVDFVVHHRPDIRHRVAVIRVAVGLVIDLGLASLDSHAVE